MKDCVHMRKDTAWNEAKWFSYSYPHTTQLQLDQQPKKKKGLLVLRKQIHVRKNRLAAFALHLLVGPRIPFQHMWLQSAPFWGLSPHGRGLHLCRSGNFRLKLLRVEFSSKQIAPRISPHNLPFTDPRNHTVWVLGNQLTVAQTVDGYAGGFMIGIACAAGFMRRRAKWEKDNCIKSAERICHLLLWHTQRLTCNWSTVTRSTKALLSAAPPDAWWAKWASVLTSATDNRLETRACRTTQTDVVSCQQNFIYGSNAQTVPCAISLDNHIWLQRQDRCWGAN